MKGYINSTVKESVEKKIMEVEVKGNGALVPVGVPDIDGEVSVMKAFHSEQFGEIRTVMIDGEPWFVGKDVATALGYDKGRNAISAHVDDDDALKRGVTDSLGRLQETTIINESGLYALIFGSELESAKAFKRWVTSEVLPSIRKTGKYEAAGIPALMGEMDKEGAINLIAELTWKYGQEVAFEGLVRGGASQECMIKEVCGLSDTQMLRGGRVVTAASDNDYSWRMIVRKMKDRVKIYSAEDVAGLAKDGANVPEYYVEDIVKRASKRKGVRTSSWKFRGKLYFTRGVWENVLDILLKEGRCTMEQAEEWLGKRPTDKAGLFMPGSIMCRLSIAK